MNPASNCIINGWGGTAEYSASFWTLGREADGSGLSRLGAFGGREVVGLTLVDADIATTM